MIDYDVDLEGEEVLVSHANLEPIQDTNNIPANLPKPVAIQPQNLPLPTLQPPAPPPTHSTRICKPSQYV
jgi:hypothetical protein